MAMLFFYMQNVSKKENDQKKMSQELHLMKSGSLGFNTTKFSFIDMYLQFQQKVASKVM